MFASTYIYLWYSAASFIPFAFNIENILFCHLKAQPTLQFMS